MLTFWSHLAKKKICSVAKHLKAKKLVYLREMKINLDSATILYILAHAFTSSIMSEIPEDWIILLSN